MRKIFTIIVAVLLTASVFAQYPEIPYHPNSVEPALYLAPNDPFSFSDWITNVTFAGINNTTANSSWRNNYSGTTHATVQRGQTYTLSVTVNSTGCDFSFQDISAYIDWDRDGDCGGRALAHGGTGIEVAESYTLGGGAGHANPLTVNITVPNDAQLGTTWLRVVLKADGYPASDAYLGYFGYGEIEEYAIDVTAGNSTPTDISLSASSINENVAANSTVGTLSTTDTDAGNTFTYTLVSGTGSTDNVSFNTSGSSLRITNSPNYETKSSYTLRIRTTDQGGLYTEKAFTITINDLNETPTNISLSASSINENVAANSTVGTLSTTDTDAGNTFTYTLVSGTGSTDNVSFNTSGSSLRITNSPNYETKSSYTLRIRTTDQGGLYTEKAFTITINDLNETPTNISLSASSINENVAANSTVGTLSTTDTDAGNTFTYTLVSGTGSTDNVSFNISGSSLLITASPDFEAKNSYSVRVRTTDQGSLTFEKVFTITIINVDEAPTVTTQAVSSIAETTATGNGNITNLGDPNPTQYGVVWSTSNNPTVDLTTKTEEGAIAVSGAFASSITGLIKNTTYYVKAYATNATGTVYGDEVSFTTLDVTTNINESMVTSFNIYPNPAKEKIMIQGMTKGDKAYLYNQSGQFVLISDEAEIDITQLQSGIYMIRINEKVVKLIKD